MPVQEAVPVPMTPVSKYVGWIPASLGGVYQKSGAETAPSDWTTGRGMTDSPAQAPSKATANDTGKRRCETLRLQRFAGGRGGQPAR